MLTDPLVIFGLGALGGAVLTVIAQELGYWQAKRETRQTPRQTATRQRPESFPTLRGLGVLRDVRTPEQAVSYLDALDALSDEEDGERELRRQ